MNLNKRILSTLLAVILALGSFSMFSVIGVSAAAEEEEAEVTLDQVYLTTVFNTPEEKVYGKEGAASTMTLMMERGNHQLYVDKVSGEIAVVDTVTGSILLSNPYDVSECGGHETVALEALSQLNVQFLDNGTTKTLRSFKDAAMVDQISVFKIKNGVRAEYIIGSEATRRLVPRLIPLDSYTKYIDEPMKAAIEKGDIDDFLYRKFSNYFKAQSLDDPTLSKKAKEQLILDYPCIEKFDIVVCRADTPAKIAWCEIYIKAYCENYTFEQLDADHEKCGYVAEDERSPVFKMALEYSLDENGALSVRLPCNGLRYDMTAYTLENLSVLPYMGAGNGAYEGYNFFPDGSGSLFDFGENTKTTTTKGKVYGIDYAYHQISGKLQKTIRYPVYGTVATEEIYSFSYKVKENNKEETKTMSISGVLLEDGDVETYVTETLKGELLGKPEKKTYKRGYVAVIESGESLADIATYHAGSLSSYHTMMNYFNPKPKDSYDIADAISATSSSTWTVVSDRKYTGSITIRYMILNDPEIGKKAQTDLKAEGKNYAFYDTTWMGMAEAYRDYMVEKGNLTPLAGSDKLYEDIPLYMEVFGALETEGDFLTIPVSEMTPLTTFEDVYTMYNNLYEKGNIKNINFKLTGFANGGMYATMPSSLKWEKVVGGKDGFKQLIKDAADVKADKNGNLGLYPDFDFAYSHVNELFDSLNLKKDAVKTIDNRYSSKRQYSATQQTYVSFFELAISPSRYSKFYNKLLANYEGYDLKTLSIGSLGSALNTDFDEDDPFNREDSKQHTIQAFQDMKKAGYSLMTEGGNAYTWKYVDHILNVDLDSSRYIKASASVPFIGVVLHGYVQIAGAPMNKEGDVNYAILRALENGAAPYFVLSYRNTSELKEDPVLSQNYSIRYDIWEEDVISLYNEMNGLLKDVQDKVIIGHKFLNDESERVLDLDELQESINNALNNAFKEEEKNHQNAENDMYIEVADAWRFSETVYDILEEIVNEMVEISNEEIIGTYEDLQKTSSSVKTNINSLLTELNTLYEREMNKEPETGTGEEAETGGEPFEKPDPETVMEIVLNSSNPKRFISLTNNNIRIVRTSAVKIIQSFATLNEMNAQVKELYKQLEDAIKMVRNSNAVSPEVAAAIADEMQAYLDAATPLLQTAEDELNRVMNEKNITNDTAVAAALDVLKLIDITLYDPAYAMWEDALIESTKESLFTAEDIYKEAEETDDTDEDKKEDEVISNTSLTNNNQVVLVIYGDRADKANGFEKTATKGFILNYNTFAVRVTYNGVVYTVPSGGYVVITY